MDILAWPVRRRLSGSPTSVAMGGSCGDVVARRVGAILVGRFFAAVPGRPDPLDNPDPGAIASLRAVAGRRVA